MAKIIAEVWAEVRVTDAPLTPEEYEAAAVEALRQYAAAVAGTVVVIRTNSFYVPEPEVPPEDPDAPRPIPDDGSTGGDG